MVAEDEQQPSVLPSGRQQQQAQPSPQPQRGGSPAGGQAAVPPAAGAASAAADGKSTSEDDHPDGALSDGPGEPASGGGGGPGSAFDPAFARLRPPFAFWQDALLLLLLGGAMGAFAYGYLKAISEVTDLWLSADGRAGYPSPATLGFGTGRPWYVGLCAGTGLIVGVAKVRQG